MPTEHEIDQHRQVQMAAKTALNQLGALIGPDDSERSIAEKAHQLLCQQGFPDTWYYQCPALVLAGSRSCISVSGKNYQPGEDKLGLSNLVTVDLSPTRGPYWGDYARSFVLENGVVTSQPQQIEFRNGLIFLERMHLQMQKLVKPGTTFGQLFDWANLCIRQGGFVNLDYRNNVGHSIATERDLRQFIELNNQVPLAAVPFFSFEPFVRLKGGKWGFKREGIFFFNQAGQLEEL